MLVSQGLGEQEKRHVNPSEKAGEAWKVGIATIRKTKVEQTKYTAFSILGIRGSVVMFSAELFSATPRTPGFQIGSKFPNSLEFRI